MSGWQLQASIDLQKWVILDKREVFQEMVGIQGFAIREDTMTKYPEGFSAFRVVQTQNNSINTHNLSITHFEVYGEPANEWH
jgi:hypothetical protein